MSDAEQPPAQPLLPSPYDGGGKRRGRTRRVHTVAKVLLATLLTLGMVSGLSVAFLYRHFNDNLHVVDISGQLYNRPKKVHLANVPHQPINILVMGSDSRDGKGDDIDGLTGGGARSDTTILFHLSADRKTAYGISIPRDSLVDRPDCKKKDGSVIPGGTDQMWNAAFAYGGPSCTVEQFEQLTHIPIDHYVVLDFNGFRGMVDAVGGVQVCVPNDINDDVGHIHIKAGTRTLDGREALSYVRVRHGVGDGSDIGRITRQQAFLSAMAAKVVSGGVLARPDKLLRFVDAATKSLTTDYRNIKDIAETGLQFKHIGLSHIRFLTVPFVYDGPRVRWTSDAPALWQRVLRDQPLGKFRAGTLNAGNVPGVTTPTQSPSSTSSSSSSPSSTPTESPSTTPSESASTQGANPSTSQLEQAGLCT